jgi:hypothetical protein
MRDSLLSVCVAALVAAGCSTASKVSLQPVGQSPAGVVSGLDSLPVGIVLGFRMNASSSAVVTEAIDDPTVAIVAPTTQASEFVVIGLATGQTTLHVFVDNSEAIELPVQVTPSAP